MIIKSYKRKFRSVKWKSFEALSLIEFENEILELIQNQFDFFVRKNDYIIIYKQSSSYKIEILLVDEKEWKKFLLDYKRILSIKKDLMIITVRDFTKYRISKYNSNRQMISILEVHGNSLIILKL